MLTLENFLAPSNVIGRGCTISILEHCLAFAIGNKPGSYFNYMRPFPGMDYSIRVLGEKPFEESASFHRPFSPEELAMSLLKYSEASQPENRARYPIRPSLSAIKGWTISKSAADVDEERNPLVAAYATWID
jgi:hypothetical protein